MRDIEIEEMHKILLDILSSIHEFCIKNNIQYSLGGGTLLGAIRHKGFIPWDDDVDLMMTRNNYEKFVTSFNSNGGLYQCIQNVNNGKTCYFDVFAKVHDVRTICNEKRNAKFSYGVNIDIFPVDNYPTNKLLSNIYVRYCSTLRRLLLSKFIINKPKGIVDRLIHIFSYAFPTNWLYKWATNALKWFKNTKSKYKGAICGRYGEKERYKKEIFNKYIILPFENKEFMVIADYHIYLQQHYGDYMKLPPVEQRVNHSSTPKWL